jgi:hypothetical protein
VLFFFSLIIKVSFTTVFSFLITTNHLQIARLHELFECFIFHIVKDHLYFFIFGLSYSFFDIKGVKSECLSFL